MYSRLVRPAATALSSRYALPAFAAIIFMGMLLLHEMMLHHPTTQEIKHNEKYSPIVEHADVKKLANMSQEMMNCINAHQPKKEITTWKSAMSETDFTAVKIAKVWWSNRTARVPMTVVTQLSFDRLEQLVKQCGSWPGPISAVLYVELPLEHKQPDAAFDDPDEVLKTAIERTGELHNLVDGSLPCQLDLSLAYEYFSDDEASMLYPINILRNYARLQARTPLVGLFDADMLVSSTLFDKLSDPAEVERWMEGVRRKEVVVIPGFVTNERGGLSREYIADRMTMANKSVIELMYHGGVMTRFDPTDNGHTATNYMKWFNATKPYPVKYQYRYEPWVVAGRTDVPFYDVRFRGYGQNKIIHCEYMNMSGYTFIVDSDSWLTHRAHSFTRAKLRHASDAPLVKKAKQWREEWFQNVYGHTAHLGNLTRKAMARGAYHPPLDPATVACTKILSWWKDYRIPD